MTRVGEIMSQRTHFELHSELRTAFSETTIFTKEKYSYSKQHFQHDHPVICSTGISRCYRVLRASPSEAGCATALMNETLEDGGLYRVPWACIFWAKGSGWKDKVHLLHEDIPSIRRGGYFTYNSETNIENQAK